MTEAIDKRAFWCISYGLYIVTACKDGKMNGQISNTVFQLTDNPPTIAVSINKTELTHEYITNSGHFGVSILEQDTPLKTIGTFGFRSGREIDKLSQVNYQCGEAGCPLVTDHAIAVIEADVEQQVDVGTHTLFVGRVTSSKYLKQAEPMTYAYYYEVKKGKSPDTAPVAKRDPNFKLSQETPKGTIDN